MEKGASRGSRKGKLLACSIEVVLWAIAQRHPITSVAIIERWEVHRNTAWRWRDLLEDARQRVLLMPPPRPRQPATDVAAHAPGPLA